MANLLPSQKAALPPAEPSSTSSPSSSTRIFTRAQLARSILDGHVLVIHDWHVYRLNAWLAHHPGGDLAILHFVGRDATDEIEAYHSQDTLERVMPRFRVGVIAEEEREGWVNLTPPVQLGWRHGRREGYTCQGEGKWELLDERGEKVAADEEVHDEKQVEADLASPSHPFKSLPPSSLPPIPLTPASLEPPSPPSPSLSPQRQAEIQRAYRQLHARVKAAGLYTIQRDAYLYEMMRYTALFVAFAALYYNSWFVASGAALGLFWHQVTFVVHDAGHTEITGKLGVDRTLACFIASFIGGLSANWWCDNHDIHHIVTNHPEHDPDIQHIPFFAISTRFFASMWSTYYRRVMAFDLPARFLLPMQHRLYYIVMSLARFNLFAQSYIFLFTKARNDWYRNFEFVGIAIFWLWYGALLRHIPIWPSRLAFLLLSNICASPLHVQIVLSHFARSTEDLGLSECFAHRQLRTTMDVACPAYLSFMHGGLDMQVSHHLFPRVPRHNLRATRDLVVAFAQEQGLEYAEYGFIRGNGQVLDVLREVAQQVKFVGKVAAAEARGQMKGQ